MELDPAVLEDIATLGNEKALAAGLVTHKARIEPFQIAEVLWREYEGV